MSHSHCQIKSQHSQHGAILIVAMIILLVLSLLGIAGMQTGVLEQKMAGYMQDRQIAFEMAERALRDGETWLQAQVSLPDRSNTPTSDEVWELQALEAGAVGDKGWWASVDSDWWSDNAVAVEDLSDLEGEDYIAEVPAYVIAELGTIQAFNSGDGQGNADKVVHIITARGVGTRPTTVVYLQSTYTKRYD